MNATPNESIWQSAALEKIPRDVHHDPVDVEAYPLTMVSAPTTLSAVGFVENLSQALPHGPGRQTRFASIDRRKGMKLQIMSPAANRVDFKVPPAPRLASLEGKTIGLYNNMTGGADVAVDRVAMRISERFPNVKFERYGGDLRPGRPALSRGNHIDDEEGDSG